jgi:hypothetical protein
MADFLIKIYVPRAINAVRGATEYQSLRIIDSFVFSRSESHFVCKNSSRFVDVALTTAGRNSVNFWYINTSPVLSRYLQDS